MYGRAPGKKVTGIDTIQAMIVSKIINAFLFK